MLNSRLTPKRWLVFVSALFISCFFFAYLLRDTADYTRYLAITTVLVSLCCYMSCCRKMYSWNNEVAVLSRSLTSVVHVILVRVYTRTSSHGSIDLQKSYLAYDTGLQLICGVLVNNINFYLVVIVYTASLSVWSKVET
jgi:hypothetical protein